MEKRLIKVPLDLPYYKVGMLDHTTREIWVIFHGYGQLAEEFAQDFDTLKSPDNVFIFPQGLSTFYLKSVAGKVGANWMTSHERAQDIANYITYLNALFSMEIEPFLTQCVVNVLGFSQGGHTASRWIYKAGIDYQKFILWGSSLASEFGKEEVARFFSHGKNTIFWGDSDKFIDPDRRKHLINRYGQIGFDYHEVRYRGTHKVYPALLRDYFI